MNRRSRDWQDDDYGRSDNGRGKLERIKREVMSWFEDEDDEEYRARGDDRQRRYARGESEGSRYEGSRYEAGRGYGEEGERGRYGYRGGREDYAGESRYGRGGWQDEESRYRSGRGYGDEDRERGRYRSETGTSRYYGGGRYRDEESRYRSGRDFGDYDRERGRSRSDYGSSGYYSGGRGYRDEDRERGRYRAESGTSRYYGGGGYQDEDRGRAGSGYSGGRDLERYGSDYGRSGGYGGRDHGGSERGAGYGYSGQGDEGRGGEGQYGGRLDPYRSGDYGELDFGDESRGGRTSRTVYSELWLIPGPHQGVGPKGYQRSPESLKERVCERLQEHGEINPSELSVEVENEEVTLRGKVADRRQKRLAEACAESVRGVKDVHNRLTVDEKLAQEQRTRQSVAREDTESSEQDVTGQKAGKETAGEKSSSRQGSSSGKRASGKKSPSSDGNSTRQGS